MNQANLLRDLVEGAVWGKGDCSVCVHSTLIDKRGGKYWNSYIYIFIYIHIIYIYMNKFYLYLFKSQG